MIRFFFSLVDDSLRAKVIFCTAYEQYAVRAFEVNALDYLVKPVAPEQVERALKRLGAHEESRETLELDDSVALREAHAMRLTPLRAPVCPALSSYETFMLMLLT